MGTYTVDQYQRKWRMVAKQLKKAAEKSTRDAALFMRNTARGMAPIGVGKLRQGINANPKTNQEWEVSSIVPGNFPYNMWVNQQAPYRTLHFKQKGGWIPPSRSKTGGWVRAFPPNTNVLYGDGSHINTGSPRFWHLATIRTVDVFGKLARKNVQKALQVRLT